MVLIMFKRFELIIQRLRNEQGQAMIEYALILAVIAVISVAVFVGSDSAGKRYGDSVSGIYQQADNAINQINIPANNEGSSDNQVADS